MRVRVTVTMDNELRERIRDSADHDKRDASTQTCVLVEEALANREKRK